MIFLGNLLFSISKKWVIKREAYWGERRWGWDWEEWGAVNLSGFNV